MKKLLTLLFLMLFSTSMFSQEETATTGLRVVNYTPCVQYFVVVGVEECICKSKEPVQHAISPLIKIEPAISPTNPSTLLLLTSELFSEEVGFEYIIQVRIMDGNYCGGGSPAGQPCAGVPFTYVFKALGEKCVLCPDNKITIAIRKPAKNCEDMATLTFVNP